jgi:sulfite exporter TauE/SafE/copper chaperone CopZ
MALPERKATTAPVVSKTRICIGGMTCISCERRILKALLSVSGVKAAKVSYQEGFAEIEFDPEITGLSDFRKVVENAGYLVSTVKISDPKGFRRSAGFLLIIAVLYTILSQSGILNLLVPGQLAEENMGYGMLFVVGLLTSVHCVAMCGGINLTQTIGKSGLASTAAYNLGRVIAYTTGGFLAGALGSAISFTPATQGLLKLAAGIFMVLMGVNMLGLFPSLRKLSIKLPYINTGSKSPLIVGILNGLMPCGPLQSMQIYALSTGSPVKGAFSMLLFALGTVPLMFGLGALSSILSKKFTRRMVTVGAVLVVILGLSMFSQGWSLSGFHPLVFSGPDNSTETGDRASMENGVQVVNSTLQSGRYPKITVQTGIPVKWVIDAPKGSINGCNNAFLIPEYNLEHKFKTGENVIEFTPFNTGTFQYSCWMGMIRSTITVREGDQTK